MGRPLTLVLVVATFVADLTQRYAEGDAIVDTGDDCVDGAGISYRGGRSYTRSGILCQRWDVSIPHKPKHIPEDGGHHNYCRNPDKDSKGVWCYTVSVEKRWEYCDITECPDELLVWTETIQGEKTQLVNIKVNSGIIEQLLTSNEVLNITSITGTISEGPKTEYWAVAANYKLKELYYTDSRQEYLGIWNMQEDESQRYFEGMVRGVENMAYDPMSKNLYLTYSDLKWVMVTDRTFTHYTSVYKTDPDAPYGLAIHSRKRLLIFSTFKPLASKMIITDMAGQNAKIIFQFPDVYDVTGITVDHTNDRIYWTDFTGHGSMIMSSLLDGTNRTQHYYQGGAIFWGVAEYLDYLFVTDVHVQYDMRKYHDMWVMNKHTTDRMRYKIFGKPRGITIYNRRKDYSMESNVTTGECPVDCHHICLTQIDATWDCACSLGYYLDFAKKRCISKLLVDNYLLIADSVQGRIFQMPLHSHERNNDTFQYSIVPLDENAKLDTVAVDLTSGDIYWSDIKNPSVKRSTLGGSRQEILVKTYANNIVIDPFTGNIFYSDEEKNTITLTNKDGTQRKTIVKPDHTNSSLKSMVQDIKHKYLYWTDTYSKEGEGKVFHCRFDGSEKEIVLDNFNWPHAIATDYDRDHIYVAEAKVYIIYEYELSLLAMNDNSTRQQPFRKYDNLFSGSSSYISGMSIHKGIAYLTEAQGNSLYSLNLTEDVASITVYGPSEFFRPWSISVYSRSLYADYIKPLSDPCKTANCGVMCIAVSDRNFKCVCEDGKRTVGPVCLNDNSSEADDRTTVATHVIAPTETTTVPESKENKATYAPGTNVTEPDGTSSILTTESAGDVETTVSHGAVESSSQEADDALIVWTNTIQGEKTELVSMKVNSKIIKQLFNATSIINITNIIGTISEGPKTEYWAVAADYKQKQLFYTNYRQEYIAVKHIKEDDSRQYLKEMMHGGEDIAYDWVSGNLYWTDSNLDKVMVTDRTFTYYTSVYETKPDPPYGLAIHSVKRLLVFSTYRAPGSKLMISDMAGQNAKILFQSPEVFDVTGITLDYTDDRIYWTDFTGFGGMIMSSFLDGTDKIQHHYVRGSIFWGVAEYLDYMFVTDVHAVLDYGGKSNYSIWVMNKHTTNRLRLKMPGKPRGIAVYSRKKEYYMDSNTTVAECPGDCHHVCLAKNNATHECACSLGYHLDLETGGCVSKLLADNYLLVADSGQGRIFQMPVNAPEQNNETLQYSIVPLGDDGRLATVAVDITSGDIYWSDMKNPFVKRSALGASRHEIIVDTYANSIVVDPFTGNVFYSDKDKNTITLTNKNGTQRKTIVKPDHTNSSIKSMVQDIKHKYLYWTDTYSKEGEGKVFHCRFDGSEKEIVLDNFNWPHAIAIDYERDQMYVADAKAYIIYGYELSSLAMNDNSTRQLPFRKYDKSISRLSSYISGMSIYKGIAYLTEAQGNSLYSLNLSEAVGSINVYGPSEFFRPWSISVYSRSLYDDYIEPLGNPCQTANCGVICIAVSDMDFRCLCEDGKRMVGLGCVNDNSTEIAPDDRTTVATHAIVPTEMTTVPEREKTKTTYAPGNNATEPDGTSSTLTTESAGDVETTESHGEVESASQKADDALVVWTYTIPGEKTELVSMKVSANIIKQINATSVMNTTNIIGTISEGLNTEYWALAADYKQKELYYTDYRQEYLGVWKMLEDRSLQYFKGMMHGVENIAYDWVSGNLYWTDSDLHWVMAADPTYAYYTPVYKTAPGQPYGLAIHSFKRLLIFSIYQALGSKMMTTDMSGQSAKTILEFPKIVDVTGITIDYTDDRIYWSDFTGYGGMIMSSFLDGSDRTVHHYVAGATLWDVSEYLDFLFVTDTQLRYESDGKSFYIMWVLSKRTKDKIKNKLPGKPRGITVYKKKNGYHKDLNLMSGECSQGHCHHLCLPRINTTRECACSLGYHLHLPSNKCLPKLMRGEHLLVSDLGQGRIFQMPITTVGQNNRSLHYSVVPLGDNQKVFTVAVDTKTGYLYWSDTKTQSVKRRLLDGANYNSKTVLNSYASNILVDPFTGNLFYTSNDNATVTLSNNIGTKRKTIIMMPLPDQANETIVNMALDLKYKYLYWTGNLSSKGKGKVYRCRFDGTEVEVVLDNLNRTGAITIDHKNEYLYVVGSKNAHDDLPRIYEIKLSTLVTIKTTLVDGYRYYDVSRHLHQPPFILDFKVHNHVAYITDGSHNFVKTFNLTEGVSSMVPYGPPEFFHISALAVTSESFYTKYIEPMGNPCLDVFCQSICVPISNRDYRCLCEDGKIPFGRNCIVSRPDVDPPTYDKCPGDVELSLPICSDKALYSWREPVWNDTRTDTDNLVISVPAMVSPVQLGPGRYNFIYSARDEADNIGYCNFSVYVEDNRCLQMPDIGSGIFATKSWCGSRVSSFTVQCIRESDVIWSDGVNSGISRLNVHCSTEQKWVGLSNMVTLLECKHPNGDPNEPEDSGFFEEMILFGKKVAAAVLRLLQGI